MSDAEISGKIRFFCFHCFEPVSAPVKFVGRMGKCNACGKLTRVPAESTRRSRGAAVVVAIPTREPATTAPIFETQETRPNEKPVDVLANISPQTVEDWKQIFRGRPETETA